MFRPGSRLQRITVDNDCLDRYLAQIFTLRSGGTKVLVWAPGASEVLSLGDLEKLGVTRAPLGMSGGTGTDPCSRDVHVDYLIEADGTVVPSPCGD
jgi:hypothetical protein